MNNIKTALSYLNKNILKNCDLITFLNLYPNKIKFYYNNCDGVCFFVKNKNIFCISTDSKDVAKRIATTLPYVSNCICKSYWDFYVLNQRFKFKNVERLYQYFYQKNKSFIASEEIKKLTIDNINEIIANFSVKISQTQLKELLSLFNFYGYFLYGKIVGIVGRHISGEIGFLEVLEQYRNHGIATELYNTIINENSNIIPYSQVLKTNYKSMNLQKKLHAKKYAKTVYWCYENEF